MASPAAAHSSGIVPAQLGFLAIFNPSLGNTDETIEDQIIYYASVSEQPTSASSHRRRRRARNRTVDDIPQAERHDRLRQVGLAQAINNFGRGFAESAPVDAVETERSRVVLHELEPGWWILASIDLTKLPLPRRLRTGEAADERCEYSSREMKPASLLLRDLLRAHHVFLLHHSSSLSDMFVRVHRAKFVTLLSRYWDLFLSTWNVMLHGNPAREIFGGINLAACGELGVGVGEEERGSGEREVLEGLAGRTTGLVELVVSQFGAEEGGSDAAHGRSRAWLGTGREPAAEDGAIFLGTGKLSRRSLRDVTQLMEDIYTWGDHAYGVLENPLSVRRPRPKKSARPSIAEPARPSPDAPAVKPTENPAGDDAQQQTEDAKDAVAKTEGKDAPEDGKLDKMLGYMKLGYGSYWNLPGGSRGGSGKEDADRKQPHRPTSGSRSKSNDDAAAGHFLIGLRGSLEENTAASDDSDSDGSDGGANARISLRTVHLEVESGTARPEASVVKDVASPTGAPTGGSRRPAGVVPPASSAHDLNKAQKLHVVVYANQPFLFAFFFRLHNDSLAWEILYRTLHLQLAPLRRPLLASTCYRPRAALPPLDGAPVHSLAWDPASLLVHAALPSIPEAPAAAAAAWSRADALSTHLHLLNLHDATRGPRVADRERTCKTSRGWWICWTRLPPAERAEALSRASSSAASASSARPAEGEEEEMGLPEVAREVFLVRRDRSGADEPGHGDSADRLAQGFGLATRPYIEELLRVL